MHMYFYVCVCVYIYIYMYIYTDSGTYIKYLVTICDNIYDNIYKLINVFN